MPLNIASAVAFGIVSSTVVVVVVIALPARVLASLHSDHNWSKPPEICWWKVVVTPDLVTPSVTRMTRFHWLLGNRPRDRLTWQLSALWNGTSSGSLATWTNRALWQRLLVSQMDGRPVITDISSFQMNWCHFICRSLAVHVEGLEGSGVDREESPGF